MLKIAIVDDNKDSTEIITGIVKETFEEDEEVIILNSFSRSENVCYEAQDRKTYDVYLLDIEMPGITGMELARIIHEEDMEAMIIFITSHPEFAMDGYEVNAYRYILKSQISEKLPKALRDVSKEIREGKNSFYYIQTNSRYERVYYKDILYMKKDEKNTVFVTKDGDKQVRKSMRQVFEEMNRPEFVYIDRGVIVNIIHITEVKKTSLTLDDEITLRVSKPHLREVKEQINAYWRDHI